MKKSSINWRTHVIELLVVIIGISIAFALEGWSEAKKNSKQELGYLKALKSDLIRDQSDLLSVLDSSEVITGHVMEVFGLIYSNKNLEAYKRHHITSSYTAPYFYPNNSTYISLVNSGNLNLIKEFEITTRLAELYNLKYKELERADAFLKNLVDDIVYPYMLMNIRFSPLRNGIEDISPLKTNQSINMLGSYLNFLGARKTAYERVQMNIDSLIKVIDTYSSNIQ